jgi:hypothetical protein
MYCSKAEVCVSETAAIQGQVVKLNEMQVGADSSVIYSPGEYVHIVGTTHFKCSCMNCQKFGSACNVQQSSSKFFRESGSKLEVVVKATSQVW